MVVVDLVAPPGLVVVVEVLPLGVVVVLVLGPGTVVVVLVLVWVSWPGTGTGTGVVVLSCSTVVLLEGGLGLSTSQPVTARTIAAATTPARILPFNM